MGRVTLIDGREVDSASEEWRAECEARHVLSLQPIQRRRDYIAGCTTKRGENAGKALADLVRKVWDHNRLR
jgi:hypothetical protein